MASKLNFSLDLGSDQTVEITYAPNKVNFDLSAWVVKCQLRRQKSSTTVDLELISPGTINVAGPVVLLPFLADAIKSLSGRYTYDVFGSQGTLRRKIVEGIVTVNTQVTRPVP